MQDNHDLIGYDEIIENSMRTVIYETLKKVENGGLPGSHYFIISFLTNFPDVKIPKSLKNKYHDEMTIVVQFQFKDLKAQHEHFEISLSFSGKYEKLYVPYKSVTSFADPSMNFGLKFSVSFDEIEPAEISVINTDDHANKNKSKKVTSKKSSTSSKSSAKKSTKKTKKIDTSDKVVSLDAFRKEKNNDN